MLSVQNLSKSFPSSGGLRREGGLRRVLNGVSFDLPPGAVLCLAGPNGSGKTTLLKTLSGLLSPEEGKVLLDGLDVHLRPREARRRIGFASTEDHSFYGRLSAGMNLWFYAQLFDLPKKIFEERLARLAVELDLEGILKQPFRELSSGQKQRMLLARALLHDPDVLLLDEPHQNLDPTASARLRALLRETWPARGKALLVSTHHLDEALRISDQWLVLSAGKIVFRGSFEAALRARPGLRAEDFFQELTSGAAV